MRRDGDERLPLPVGSQEIAPETTGTGSLGGVQRSRSVAH